MSQSENIGQDLQVTKLIAGIDWCVTDGTGAQIGEIHWDGVQEYKLTLSAGVLVRGPDTVLSADQLETLAVFLRGQTAIRQGASH